MGTIGAPRPGLHREQRSQDPVDHGRRHGRIIALAANEATQRPPDEHQREQYGIEIAAAHHRQSGPCGFVRNSVTV